MSERRSVKCKIAGCRSTDKNAQMFILDDERICIHHFEAKYLRRKSHDSDGSVTFALKENAVPTLLLDDESTYSKPNAKRKRGSSGLANLQKARMKKILRKERLKKQLLLRQMKPKKGNVDIADKTATTGRKSSESDVSQDYFLSDREATPAEKLIIPLRLTTLTKRLHDGSNVCKNPPACIKDSKIFPTLNIIKTIDGLDENPLEWTPNHTFSFVKVVSPVKGIAKRLRSEDVDGEALLNLTKFDLSHYFKLNESTSEALFSIFSQLRREVIGRYINI